MPTQRRPVTVADIARQAGVSHQVVSAALRLLLGRPTGTVRVSTETAQRVQELALSMGYRPNAAALSMRSRRHRRIALLMSLLPGRSHLPEGFLEALHDGLATAGLELALHRVDDRRLTDLDYVPGILRQWSCDALAINYSVAPPPRLAELVSSNHVPAIWINRRLKADCVTFADRAGGGEAARRLIVSGHRRLAWFCLDGDLPSQLNGHDSQSERLAGFRQACVDAGVEVEVRSGRDFAWLKQPCRPTAVACYSDLEACLVLGACLQLGLRLPTDLSVIAISEWGPHVHLGLARIQVDGLGLGAATAAALLRAVESGTLRQTPVEVAMEFVPGSTLGPPPN